MDIFDFRQTIKRYHFFSVLFTVFPQNMEGMDLDMLAPYISMDDDFQLTFLSGFPEDADKPPSPLLSESSAVMSAAAMSRKR